MKPRMGNIPNNGDPRSPAFSFGKSSTFDYLVPVDLGLTDSSRSKTLRDIRTALQELGFSKVPTVGITEVGTYEEAIGKKVDLAKVEYVTNHGVYDLHVSVADIEGQPGRDNLVAYLDQLHARHSQPGLFANFPVSRNGVMALTDLAQVGMGRELGFGSPE